MECRIVGEELASKAIKGEKLFTRIAELQRVEDHLRNREDDRLREIETIRALYS